MNKVYRKHLEQLLKMLIEHFEVFGAKLDEYEGLVYLSNGSYSNTEELDKEIRKLRKIKNVVE